MKKSVKILCGFLLFIFLLQLPFFGYVPFFGEWISENKLTKYANETGSMTEKYKPILIHIFLVENTKVKDGRLHYRIIYFQDISMMNFI